MSFHGEQNSLLLYWEMFMHLFFLHYAFVSVSWCMAAMLALIRCLFVFLRLTFRSCLDSNAALHLCILSFILKYWSKSSVTEGQRGLRRNLWNWLFIMSLSRCLSLVSSSCNLFPRKHSTIYTWINQELKTSVWKDKEQIVLTLITNVCERLVQLWNVNVICHNT